ncbi:putative F-box domain-containing protein [Helianthus annuus]|uniref:F-box domain-containing protein n=1 Tax=Helianthus annuus TaxID=4232 RepID=A0A9K3MXN5_HELAN|nr:F-box protein CPR1 [Helianthus annuus]KAF5779542.1 putative F-box domain-containing protein [Helianthus annuus]KAJ0490809.1 putative F-box domain-containing protein [Helianthus annuus]KAJ0495124.1 putative F-box domain-containing protein [Helianthus annuus]KAJ0506713.1 putative F-box domain-containing protein [Helianthus annuus]KAJ0676393.1 putative F-box domain-containing protein [Helianthus annuus]
MSDNIPFELQQLIINKLPVEPLIRFRSVCKAWKSLIDSPDFILNHIKQQQQQHLLVRYQDVLNLELKYVSIADNDDDTDTFPKHKVFVTLPQLVVNMGNHYTTVDSSHGLFCLFSKTVFSKTDRKAVIWNPSIRKAVDVLLPDMADDEIEWYRTVLGFGVCRETKDPKIVQIKIDTDIDMEDAVPWQVEVFTLSTGVWRSAYSGNVPSKFVRFSTGEQVVVGGVVYWLASGLASDRVDGGHGCDNLIVSFDLTSEEVGEVKLPGRLAHTHVTLSLFKLRESLVVIEGGLEDYKLVYHVWRMEDGVPKLFEKLFTIGGHSPDGSMVSVRGFRMTGEALVDLRAHPGFVRTLAAYEPYSNSIKNLGISERHISVYSYTETLLLL